MTGYQRAHITNQGLVEAPAKDVWAFLVDWAGTQRGGLKGNNSPGAGDLSFSKVELIGEENEIPRTRVFHFEKLGTIRETLLYQNDEAMHLYYNIEGEGPLGIRNYLATTDIDATGDRMSQVTITARFDLSTGEDIARAKGLIDAAHNGVIGAMRKCFT